MSGSAEDGAMTATKRNPGSRPPLREMLGAACAEIEGLTGRPVDGVSSVQRSDQGWVLALELVELERIPASTSVIGSYQVTVDESGSVLEYERTRRYFRNQPSDEEYA